MTKTEKLPIYKPSKPERRAVLSMILPALVELVLSQAFSLVDSFMLGNAPDSVTSIAAVGLSSPLVNLIINVMSAFTIGTTATVAWFLGSRHQKDAADTAKQMLTVTGLLGLTLTLVCTFGAEPIIGFMGSNDEAVRQKATEYFSVISLGYVFQFMTINISASLRGAKITKYPMYYNLIANAAKMGINYVLIYGKLGFEPMGLRGAAVATVISQGAAFVLATAAICTVRSPVRLSLKGSFLPQRRIMQRTLRISLTATAEQLILQGGNVLFTKIIAGIPRIEFSAYNVTGSITGFVWNIGSACAVASTTYMGIGMGEGREDKCVGFTKYIIRLSVLWMSVLSMLLIATSGILPKLFVNDPDVAGVASKLIPIAALYGIPVAVHQPLAGALRSAGDTLSPLIAALCSLWVFRVFLGWILIDLCELNIFFGVLSVAADQLARAVVNLILFRRGRWKKRLKPKSE